MSFNGLMVMLTNNSVEYIAMDWRVLVVGSVDPMFGPHVSEHVVPPAELRVTIRTSLL